MNMSWNEDPPEILRIGSRCGSGRRANSQRLRAGVNQAVEQSLDALRQALALYPEASPGSLSSANTMPYLLDCVRAYATLGEICDAMRAVFGIYQEAGVS